MSKVVKGIRREIKKDGRGEIDHKPEIPKETLDAIYRFGGILCKILEARLIQKDEKAYMEAVKELPVKYQQEWHVLLRYVVQFIIQMYDGRRACEGLALLTKSHFEIQEAEGLRFFKKVKIPTS